MVLKRVGRKKSRQPITPEQQHKIYKVTAVLVFCALLWVIFSPQTGLYGFLKQKAQFERLQQKTVELQQQNKALQKDIDRLKNDPEYLERFAREKHGMMKKNERVYDFGKGK